MDTPTCSTTERSEVIVSDSKLHFRPVADKTESLDFGDQPLISQAAAFELGRVQVLRDIRTSLPLLLTDVFVAVAALWVTILVDLAVGGPFSDSGLQATFAVVGLVIFFQAFNGLYPACGVTSAEEFQRCTKTCLVVLAISILMAFATSSAVSLVAALIYFSSLFSLLWMSRQVCRRLLSQSKWWTQPVVFVGDIELASRWHFESDYARTTGLRPAGIVCESLHSHWAEKGKSTLDSRKIVAHGLENLQDVLLSRKVSRIACASQSTQNYALFRGIPHVMMPTGLGSHPVVGSRLTDSGESSLILCRSGITCPAAGVAKRIFDLVLVLLTLPFWGTLMAAIALAIRFSRDSGTVFYRQKRVGRFGNSFDALKFRSMVSDADEKLSAYLESNPAAKAEWEATHKLKNDPRITRLGAFLRKTSLDELPQLLNVLKGEMSLVGPRPIVDCDQYDRLYIEKHPEVFDLYEMVRPGITGLWQISGRNRTSYLQRVSYDRVYLQNWSLHLDVFILWRTVKTALLREGAY